MVFDVEGFSVFPDVFCEVDDVSFPFSFSGDVVSVFPVTDDLEGLITKSL